MVECGEGDDDGTNSEVTRTVNYVVGELSRGAKVGTRVSDKKGVVGLTNRSQDSLTNRDETSVRDETRLSRDGWGRFGFGNVVGHPGQDGTRLGRRTVRGIMNRGRWKPRNDIKLV